MKILWQKGEIILALSSQLISYQFDVEDNIKEVVIDSRKAFGEKIFIALKGEKNDGHNFLQQAKDLGCKTFIIQEKEAIEKIKDMNFFLVKNTFDALYKMAEFSRKRSKAKIIGITGSVGKTSVKEMLKQVFEECGKTFATIGNLNNHYGLPLCLCNFSDDCKFGIFEIGMNHKGEISPLSKLLKPNIAIITNVGPVHIEFFNNEEEIALEKAEIFFGLLQDGVALINKDNRHFDLIKSQLKNHRLISFGRKEDANYKIIKSETKDLESSFVYVKLNDGKEISYEINSINDAQIFNSIIAIAALDLCSSLDMKAVSSLKNLQSNVGRGKISDIVVAGKNITLIDDSYNASIISLRSGIENAIKFKEVNKSKRLVVALGDMLELGEKSVELHEEAIKLLEKNKIDFAILVGKSMIEASRKIDNISYQTFIDSQLASLKIADLLADGDILYLKGPRGMKMENLIQI